MLDAMISDGLRTSEMLYPDSGRFGPATGIPLVSHYILPMLGADPDRLFDELAAEVPRWPRWPLLLSTRNLFGYLAGRLGRPVVVKPVRFLAAPDPAAARAVPRGPVRAPVP